LEFAFGSEARHRYHDCYWKSDFCQEGRVSSEVVFLFASGLYAKLEVDDEDFDLYSVGVWSLLSW
jgi:hypothetical protein